MIVETPFKIFRVNSNRFLLALAENNQFYFF